MDPIRSDCRIDSPGYINSNSYIPLIQLKNEKVFLLSLSIYQISQHHHRMHIQRQLISFFFLFCLFPEDNQ